MNIVVFGASGGTGSKVVEHLVAAGHSVTAFARTPSTVNAKGGKVKVVIGDARDKTAVNSAVAGNDAVISALGPRSTKKDDIQTVFIKNVIDSMNQNNTKRIIVLSAWGAGSNPPNDIFLFKLLRGTILRHVFEDKNEAESLLVATDLEYTLVRPGRLTDKPAKGTYKVSLDGKGIRRGIARADVAKCMVDQLKNTEWVRQCPIVGY